MTTPYHAKYFAHELTRQHQPGAVECLSMALFDAGVDLNPHQIEAALFALRSPFSKGVVLAIYQQCRTTEEIDAAFKQLQQEMDETIRSRLDDTRRLLLEHFDEDVHARLKMRLDDAHANLDRIGRLFWTLTRFVLGDRASFDDQSLTFNLHQPPLDTVRPGQYHMISKTQPNGPLAGDEQPAVQRRAGTA